MLKVNGKAYDWGDVDLKIPGLNIQVQEISYDDELEIEEVYGYGSKPRGYGTGNYKASGKLSMLRDDYDDLLAYFEKLETGYMDVIRDSIESRANEVCREPEELNPMVVYLHSASYATKHGETDAYWLSDQANFSCKVAIEQAISTHYGDNRLDTASAVQEVMEKFGPERMNFILANTIQHKDADGRISRDNKAWAKTIPMPEDKESFRRNAYLVVDQVNPGLVDLFTRQARKTVQEKEKGSVLQKLKQELPAHKPAAPKKQGPER